jgi:hypothetical protein
MIVIRGIGVVCSTFGAAAERQGGSVPNSAVGRCVKGARLNDLGPASAHSADIGALAGNK